MFSFSWKSILNEMFLCFGSKPFFINLSWLQTSGQTQWGVLLLLLWLEWCLKVKVRRGGPGLDQEAGRTEAPPLDWVALSLEAHQKMLKTSCCSTVCRILSSLLKLGSSWLKSRNRSKTLKMTHTHRKTREKYKHPKGDVSILI